MGVAHGDSSGAIISDNWGWSKIKLLDSLPFQFCKHFGENMSAALYSLVHVSTLVAKLLEVHMEFTASDFVFIQC